MPAADRFFFDTNLLLYWLDRSDEAKNRLARRWVTAVWEGGAGAISWQVLNEFYWNAVRKLKAPGSGCPDACGSIRRMASRNVQPGGSPAGMALGG